MATIKDLLVKLGLDARDFDLGLDKAETRVSGFQRGVQQLGMLGGGILAAGFTAASTGAFLLGRELLTDVRMAAEAEEVMAQFEAVLKSTGSWANESSDDLIGLSESLALVTKFDDEAILSAESLMLTFTEIGEDVFPDALGAVLDMSTALGQDLQSSAIQVGKALQDPILGVTALRRVGVNFNETQTEIIKNLAETGRLEEAQAMILAELTKEFGGSAEAAGQTFAGQLTILQNRLGNIREDVGGRLIPVLLGLATTLNEYLSRPETLAFIQAMAQSIADFVASVVSQLPAFISGIQMAFGWLMVNQGVIVAAVAVIAASIIAFLVTVIGLAYSAMVPFAPLIAIIIAIAAAAYLLYLAWTSNFGGIQDKAAAVWAVVGPILDRFRTWLGVNIPLAIQALVGFWTGVLLPAFQRVLSWLQTVLFPFFSSLINLISVLLGNAFKLVAAIWTTILWPAMQKMHEVFMRNIWPIIQTVGAYFAGNFVKSLQAVSSAIQTVTGWITKLTTMLAGLKLPAWLTPGSPTPFEMGLLGIADAMRQVERTGLPAFSMSGSMSDAMAGGGAGIGGGGVVINVSSSGIVDEKDLANKIGGAVETVLRQRGYRK